MRYIPTSELLRRLETLCQQRNGRMIDVRAFVPRETAGRVEALLREIVRRGDQGRLTSIRDRSGWVRVFDDIDVREIVREYAS